MRVWVIIIAAMVIGFGAVDGKAALELDSANDFGEIDGAYFVVPGEQLGPGNASNGFLEFNDSNDENAYEGGFNTTYVGPPDPTPMEDQTGSRALLLSEVPIVTVGGVDYRQFALAIQENNEAPSELGIVSLGALQIAVTSDPAVADFSTLTPIYSMVSNTVKLTNVYPGTNLDMFLFVPDAQFTGGDYVVLYNNMDSTSDGPDEWTFVTDGFDGFTAVPEPATIMIWSVLGLFFVVARRRKA